MIGERVALLTGLFLVPLVLLWLGHRLRGSPPVRRSLFWGGVVGHVAGLACALTAAMAPPIWWAGGPFWRDFAVHWSMLLGALVGAGLWTAFSSRGRRG